MARLQDIIEKPLSGEWGNDDEEGIGIPVLRTTNFTNDGIINFSNVITRIIPSKDLSAKYLRTGDIIIEKSGGSDKQPVGRVVYFDGPDNTYLFNNFTGVLRISDSNKWDAKYLFYALFANYQKGGTRRYQNKTTGLHNLKTDQYIQDFEVPDYSREMQQYIAAVLDKVSDLIALRKRQLAKLDELIKARFVEMFGDPIKNNYGLPTKELGKVCTLKAGITTSADAIHEQSPEYPIPCYGGNGIRGYVKAPTQNGMYPIIGRQGALCGNVQLASGKFHATEHAVLVTPRIETNIIWLFYLLKYMDLFRFHTGAAQPGLAVKTLNLVDVLYVETAQQNEFANFAESIDKCKLTIQQGLDKLETMKKALMQQYFGEGNALCVG